MTSVPLFTSAGSLQGDLPREEAARGGTRVWAADTEPTVRQVLDRLSLARSDRPDDFVALKAAALASLKKKQRLRSAVLPAEASLAGRAGVEVVDVKALGGRRAREATQRIMDRVMGEEEEPGAQKTDEVAVLRRVRARMDAVGLVPPTVTVRFKDVTVEGKVIVASHALPSLAGSVSSRLAPALSKLSSGRHSGGTPPRQRHVILDAVSGVIHPGRFTLLLGPPQSGKTTLLRTLAGLTRTARGLRVSAAELTYNGLSFDQFVPERSAAYISQVDLHYGELTVRETLEFSARVQGPGVRAGIIAEIEAREAEAGIAPDPAVDAFMKSLVAGGKTSLATELTLRLLGLEHVAGTVIGSAMLRGVSGGQKKRVTASEIMAGPARALFADEISTGLDSAVTYDIMRTLRDVAHLMDSVVVVGLLQPGRETFDLFDDVMLLAAGKLVYHGPKSAVVQQFQQIGFEMPPTRGIADFLQEVAVPDRQELFWADETRAWRYITPGKLQVEFRESAAWRETANELATPFQGPPGPALAQRPYGAPPGTLLRAVAGRSWILIRRTKIFTIIRTAQVILMALVLSALFWRLDKNSLESGQELMGVLFYSSLYMLLGAIAEMHLLCDRLPVFHKQRALNFYPGWAFAIPTFLIRLPFSLMESLLWTVIVYWLVGFSARADRFFMFWCILFLVNFWSVGLFQLIAAVCRDDTISTAVGSFFLLIFINLSGYVLVASDVPPWWLEGLWTNPFYYATKALMVNEFTTADWDKPNPANPGSTLGIDLLKFRGFSANYWWCWVAIGFIIVTGVINFGLFVAALTYLGPFRRRVVLTPEALEEHQAASRIDSGPKSRHGQPPRILQFAVRAGPESPVHAPAASPGSPPVSGPASPDGSFVDPLTSSRPLSFISTTAAERLSFTSAAAEAYRSRTALPFPQLTLTFRDLEYSVPLPEDVSPSDDIPREGPHTHHLMLLHHVSGVFRPGVLTALMGASGAGKTTLMDVLAGRKTEGIITGDIRVNGHPKNDTTFARVAAYVEQTDVHLPQTSVAEAVEFSAALRLPTTVDAPTRARFVSEVLELVELDRIAGAFVGVPGVSGLSVEQRKRLSVGVELAANPSILFMDEPTSGLDARAAAVVITAIRNTVSSGRTVVCTIHQPSRDIFEAFDELLLLKTGGRCVYNGPLGDGCTALVEYLEGLPGVKPLPPRQNPADFMLENISPVAEKAAHADYAASWAASPAARAAEDLLRQYEVPKEGVPPLELGELHQPSWFYQFRTLLARFWRQYYRAPEYNVTRLAVTLLVAFFFGSLFWRQGDNVNTVAGVLNVAGVLFASSLFMGITDCLTVQHIASQQRSIMYRERAAGYYGSFAFAAAQQITELPYLAFQSILYCSIVYWMVWFQRDAGKFFLFILYFFLTFTFFVAFGLAAVALTPAVALANVLSSFFFGFFNLFAGFIVSQPQMPLWFKYWVPFMDPVFWSIYGLSISQMGSLDDVYITDLAGKTTTVPEFLAERFNWHHSMLWVIVAILAGFTLLFSFIAALALKYINYQRR